MTPEKTVKKQLTKHLKEANVYYFYPATGGYGRSGVPDVVCCYGGKFIAFECKANGNVPTALQEKNLREIRKCGGVAWVINEDNVDDVPTILKNALTSG